MNSVEMFGHFRFLSKLDTAGIIIVLVLIFRESLQPLVQWLCEKIKDNL